MKKILLSILTLMLAIASLYGKTSETEAVKTSANYFLYNFYTHGYVKDLENNCTGMLQKLVLITKQIKEEDSDIKLNSGTYQNIIVSTKIEGKIATVVYEMGQQYKLLLEKTNGKWLPFALDSKEEVQRILLFTQSLIKVIHKESGPSSLKSTEPVKIRYSDTQRTNTTNEVSFEQAIALFNKQTDRIQLKDFSVFYNDKKIALFMPLNDILNNFKELSFKESTYNPKYYTSKNDLITLTIVIYKGEKYVVGLNVKDTGLNDRKKNNYGIVMVNNFPLTSNGDRKMAGLEFNKRAVKEAQTFSHPESERKELKEVKKVTDEKIIELISAKYDKDYLEKTKNKTLNISLEWSAKWSYNDFIIGFFLGGDSTDTSSDPQG